MVIVDFSVFPVGKGEHLGKYVARSLDVIDKSKVRYQLGPMGTTMEGEWDDVFRVIKKCFEAMRKDCHRVYGTLRVDYQAGTNKRNLMHAKVESVEKRLHRKLVTAA